MLSCSHSLLRLQASLSECALLRLPSPVRSLWRATLLLALLALGGTRLTPAQADDLSITFTLFSQTGHPGDTLNYSALFTNNTSNALTVSSANFTFTDPAFPNSGSNTFFNGNGVGTGAFTVGANSSETLTDVVSLILDRTLPPTPPGSPYTSLVSFNYRAPGDTSDSVTADSRIEAVVTAAVPEASTLLGMGSLLTLGSLAALRQRKRQSAA